MMKLTGGDFVKIQDVESLTGLDRATIRFYEKEQLIKPERSENGYRNYSETDIKLLYKIKLLRKLGVPLNTIKHLEEGNALFPEVLSRQILELEESILENTKAKGICKEILDDRVTYQALDSVFYLNKLNETMDPADFQEETKSEIHPVRRYLARLIDLELIICVLRTFLVMILRVRPYNDTALEVFTPIIGYILCIPISAFLLSAFGTTPGKWLMGIRLEDPNGGKLTVYAAFARELNVIISGLGLYLPIFSQIRLYISYRDTTNGTGTEWDNDAEILYSELTILRILLVIIAISATILLNYANANDALLPKYRGNNISVEQFTSNYLDYEKAFDNDNTMILQPDGRWLKRTDYGVEITQIGNPNHKRKDFHYTFNENGRIKTIAFKDSWEDLSLIQVLPDYCYTMLYTTIASQEGMTTNELNEIPQILNEHFGKALERGGVTEGEFTIRNVTFAWITTLPEEKFLFIDFEAGHLINISGNNTQNQPITYTLEFLITIQ